MGHILAILKPEYTIKTMLLTFSYTPGTHAYGKNSDFFPYFTKGIGKIFRDRFCFWNSHVEYIFQKNCAS